MPEPDDQSISTGLYDRRAFLLGASTITATVTSSPRFASTAEVISVVPAQRHESELKGWNLGLLAPHRLERCGNVRKPPGTEQLWSELGHFGRILVRGCYVPFGDAPIKLESFLLRGSPEDSGNLKGFLRKFTRQNCCSSFIYKGYYRDTEVHHFRDGSVYGVRKPEVGSLGAFRLGDIHQYLALLLRSNAVLLDAICEDSKVNAHASLWKKGAWQEVSFWIYRSPPWRRVDPFHPFVRVTFDETGLRK